MHEPIKMTTNGDKLTLRLHPRATEPARYADALFQLAALQIDLGLAEETTRQVLSVICKWPGAPYDFALVNDDYQTVLRHERGMRLYCGRRGSASVRSITGISSVEVLAA